MKTFVSSSQIVQHGWYVVDATGYVLGRFASYVACILRGKHKVEYTPHVDNGDFVIVINAKNIIVTGNKYNNKIYYRHTGYVGGIKSIVFKQLMVTNPKRIIELAVKGMLPKGKLGRKMFYKLKVYADSYHFHASQRPKVLKF